MSNGSKMIALIGNPNSGKTTLFNCLTGSHAYVGNWPGVTVESRRGVYKDGEIECEVVDLPGIYSFSPYSQEEIISRNFVLDENPECVIDVVDATNLERNLYLLTQLMEIDVPVVIALNMADVLEKSGVTVNVDGLSKELGLPVIPVSALKSRNIDELAKVAFQESSRKRKGRSILSKKVCRNIDEVVEVYDKASISNPLFHAIKALECDEIENGIHDKEAESARKIAKSEDDFIATSIDDRYKYIADKCMVHQTGLKTVKDKLTISDKIDRVLTNRWACFPIFILMILAVFSLTFSSDLFFLNRVFGIGNGWITFEGTWFEGLLWDHGLQSPGVILTTFVQDILDGLSGLISTGLESWGASSWAVGLVSDGMVAGVFSVIGFLPQILVLFLFFSILEDCGYMARIAFVFDRLLRKLGLSGRALIPMIMGLGCSVPAILNTRTLNSEKEKAKTIRVIPFFPCSAKLEIISAISGCLAEAFGLNATIVGFSMYLLGIVVSIGTVILMNLTTQREKTPPFIMELPNYHAPRPASLLIHLWDKAKHFLEKAATVILFSQIIIWVLTHIGWNMTYTEDIGKSILASISRAISPVFTPIGWGAQLGKNGWVFTVSSTVGMVAKEAAVASLYNFANAIGIAGVDGTESLSNLIALVNDTGITMGGLISLMSFNLLTVPCFAAVASAKAELPKGKLVFTILFWLVTSYLVSMVVYLLIDYAWTATIIIPLFAILFVVAFLYSRKMSHKEANA